ncbi:NAD(P)/FAD-dependent oxidoreductase [Kineococcus rhizosphaerae]|uniref:Thioredoxin reductase n=1 Tax=Kineococcus rhizosphaerae TaxID=559628 RepID=A0A2T0R2U2_9ACTN|nr:NAD(P)/FAD-dependent oxidoreductase [Kineococcus rhizosphaerae]PRY14128.1 thioredoxin reductase [Kineococcus rhizosphaerae]
MNQLSTNDTYDAVVVGGGAAGLSAAVALGRARRSVLVVDARNPRNAPADGVHNYLTRDGLDPRELQRLGAEEVRRFGGRVLHADATGASGSAGSFSVDTTEGTVTARRLVVATGLVDELPPVPGLRERWGREVVHCPYCHGFEVSDQALGIVATSALSGHQAWLFRQWSADVVYFAHTAPPLSGERREELEARGVRIVDGEIAEVVVDGDVLRGVRLADGSVVQRQALVVAAPVRVHSPVLDALGLAKEPVVVGGVEVGDRYPSGPGGATTVPGLHLAGNVTDPQAQVVTAAGAGLVAGAAVNADLIAEETAAAVALARASAVTGA